MHQPCARAPLPLYAPHRITASPSPANMRRRRAGHTGTSPALGWHRYWMPLLTTGSTRPTRAARCRPGSRPSPSVRRPTAEEQNRIADPSPPRSCEHSPTLATTSPEPTRTIELVALHRPHMAKSRAGDGGARHPAAQRRRVLRLLRLTPDTAVGDPPSPTEGDPLDALAGAWDVRRRSRGKSGWFVLQTRPDSVTGVASRPPDSFADGRMPATPTGPPEAADPDRASEGRLRGAPG